MIVQHTALTELRSVEQALKALKRRPGNRSAIRALHDRAFALEAVIMRATGATLAQVQRASGAL